MRLERLRPDRRRIMKGMRDVLMTLNKTMRIDGKILVWDWWFRCEWSWLLKLC
jgi:hypothetical protein